MAIKTEPFVVNVGPQHPSTHGVFRMRLTLDGEVVVDMEPVIGYLHRGIEKLAEGRTYTQNIPFTDRLDYLASMSNNLAYVMAVEKLAGIPVPERAEYLRVIMAELQRIASHLIGVGAFLNDCGAFMTPFLYMFREREKILDLFEMVCGQRLTYNYMRIGGVSHDIPDEFLPALDRFVRQMPGFIDEYDQLLSLCKEYKDLSSKKNQFLQGYQEENFSLISFISEIADKYSLKPNMKEIKIYPEIKREDFILQKVKVLFTEIELKKIYEILKNIEESKNKIYISYYNQKRNREKPFLLDVEMELYVLKKKK